MGLWLAECTFTNTENSQWQDRVDDFLRINAQSYSHPKRLNRIYLHITSGDLLSEHLCGRELGPNSFGDVLRSQYDDPSHLSCLFFITPPHRNMFLKNRVISMARIKL